jgi:ankyrin repeat protein
MPSRDQQHLTDVAWRGVACVRRRGMASDATSELCRAAGRGDVAKIERLVAAGADPNAHDGTDRSTPLLWAAEGGRVAAIAALVAAGARVNATDGSGGTPIMQATWAGHAAAVDALLAAGADVHRADNDGNTSLHYASRWGYLGAARLLVEAGARADVRNEDGLWPGDEVRAPARSLIATALYRLSAAPSCRCATSAALACVTRQPCTPCWQAQHRGPAGDA